MNYIAQHHHTLTQSPFEVLNGATVLLVEPDPENRAFYSKQLSEINMHVITCDSLAAMQSLIKESNPNVVIVDPSENVAKGTSLVKQLKQEFPDLPVITISMTMREEQLDAIMQSGVSLHINRGLTRPRDLLLALEQVLATR